MTHAMLAAITTSRAWAITIALLIGAVFILGTAYMVLRRPRRPGTPDIPSAMRPGPTDQELESVRQPRMMAWGAVLVMIMALWMPLVWLAEPGANANDQKRINEGYVAQGSLLVQLSTKDNPTGFGCVRCHGANLGGGFNYFNGSVVRVPDLQTVCSGPNGNPPHAQIKSLSDIVNTIAQGRPGTDMPSWSVKYSGALDDDQINAIVNYILSIQQPVPGGAKNNVCLNPIKS
jgi:mono/diheme cytochrome c family protein